MTRKVLNTVILAIVLALLFGSNVYAKGRCGYKGKCEASTDNCHNGTVYCDKHAAEYMREKGYKYCGYPGCKVVVKTHTYCSEHECRKDKCENKVIEGTNYCVTHTNGGKATTSNRTTSKKSTSTATPKTSSTTKSSNTCSKSGCSSKKISGSSYCSKHTCQYSGCSNYTGDTTAYCSKHQSSKRSNISKSTTSKKSTQKVKMPDCDDYDSYDDFMDDWDGCMPDGSDAEDYWENW